MRCIRRTKLGCLIIGHLPRDADLVAVEVVGLLSTFAVFSCSIAYLRQRFVCTSHAPRQDWRFCVGYGLLWLTYDYQLVIGLCKFTQNFNNDCSKKRNSDRSFSTTRPNSLKRYLDFVLSITSY